MYQQTRPTNLPQSHKQINRSADIAVGIDLMVGPMACVAFTFGLIAPWSVSEGLVEDTRSVHRVEGSRR